MDANDEIANCLQKVQLELDQSLRTLDQRIRALQLQREHVHSLSQKLVSLKKLERNKELWTPAPHSIYSQINHLTPKEELQFSLFTNGDAWFELHPPKRGSTLAITDDLSSLGIRGARIDLRGCDARAQQPIFAAFGLATQVVFDEQSANHADIFQGSYSGWMTIAPGEEVQLEMHAVDDEIVERLLFGVRLTDPEIGYDYCTTHWKNLVFAKVDRELA